MRWLLLAIAVTCPVAARTWYVDPTRGDPAADGLSAEPDNDHGPLASISAAIARAEPGDTVELAAGLYRQQAAFRNKSGEVGRPITLEGNGSILDGSDVVPPERIEPVGDGRWRFREEKMIELVIIDGRPAKQGRMQRDRGKPESLPEVDQLAAGQWTWRDGWVVVRTDGAEKPVLEACRRDAGVRTSGTCDHIVVRNLTSRYHWNDGFNIHGRCRDLRFVNIVGYENMDEGFSAHDWCESDVRNAEFYRNDNGIADVNRSQTVYHNVYTHDNLEAGFLFNGGRHRVYHSRSENDRWPFRVSPDGDLKDDPAAANLLAQPAVHFDHCTVIGRPDEPRTSTIAGTTTLVNCTFLNAPIAVTSGPVMLRWCVLAGSPEGRLLDVSEKARPTFLSDQNLLQLGVIKALGKLFGPDGFAAYQQATGWDASSVAADARLNGNGRPAPGSAPYRLEVGPGYYGAYPLRQTVGPGVGPADHQVTE